MQQQWTKPKLPQKKVHIFFRKPFFWPIFFQKTLILHHPPETVHKKISQNPYFYSSKKGGQVIDPKVAKLLTLLWPKGGPSYWPYSIYIYISLSLSLLLSPGTALVFGSFT